VRYAANFAADEHAGISGDEALKHLLDGNVRFVEGKETEHAREQRIARRTALAKDQKPFAVIVSCSDSRVPPELVFDVGLGDIFVIRIARHLAESNPIIAPRVRSGAVKVVAARYDLDTGKVELLK